MTRISTWDDIIFEHYVSDNMEGGGMGGRVTTKQLKIIFEGFFPHTIYKCCPDCFDKL